ncbi:hypothetical protein L1049_011123 [Liquidambar formosana]|uniref:Uncharacterized protein n=1 Tax=Liquidambar formosana TaxID=63359 RepID=A0AAP0RRQ4_LIQFO
MVRIQVKHGDTDAQHFLYDCTSSSQIREIAEAVVPISNIQSNINRLALRLQPRLLPLYGDAKAVPLTRALSEAKSYASKDQVSYNRPLSIYMLRDHIQTIERELTVNYQLLGFSDSTQLQQFLTDTEPLPEDSTQLFWAGNELMRDKKLCDYIGKNEKTKVFVFHKVLLFHALWRDIFHHINLLMTDHNQAAVTWLASHMCLCKKWLF